MTKSTAAKTGQADDARSVRSRKALRDALLALLTEKPFDDITVREITARSRVGYATFFRHFTAKEELLNDLASEEIAGLLALTIPALDSSGSHASLVKLCDVVHARRALWTALLTGGAAGTLRSEFIRQARLLKPRFPLNEDGIPPDLLTVFGTGGTIDILAWWLAQNEEYPPARIADYINDLVIGNVLRGGALPAEKFRTIAS